MLIITNRNINESNFTDGIGNEDAFGDTVNAKGANQIRLAHVIKVDDDWQVRLVAEPSVITVDNIPSKTVFDDFTDKLIATQKNCVLFVHGFNQSFAKNIEKARQLELKHNVEVIAFSWPSKPGGFITTEYSLAQETAIASKEALNSTLIKLNQYFRQSHTHEMLKENNVKFSLLNFSLGNYLFKNYVTDPIYEAETQIFDNVILCQADVYNENHFEWVDLIQSGKRIYITINENDWALKWSEANSKKACLGRSANGLNSIKANYFDFTDGEDVGGTHELFSDETNQVVKDFFSLVLNGERGEKTLGLVYDDKINAYKFNYR